MRDVLRFVEDVTDEDEALNVAAHVVVNLMEDAIEEAEEEYNGEELEEIKSNLDLGEEPIKVTLGNPNHIDEDGIEKEKYEFSVDEAMDEAMELGLI